MTARPESFSYDVFLGHNQAQKDWTRTLALRLRDENFNVWFDEWCIRGGENFITAMEKGVENSRHLVFVASPESVEAEWPNFEQFIAILDDPTGRHRKIIPIIHTECELPRRIRFLSYIDFSDTHTEPGLYEFRLAHLMADVDESRERPKDYHAFCKTLKDYDPDAIPPISPLPLGSRMPLGINKSFVGREEEMRELAKKFLGAGTTAAIGQVEAVTGLGGIGKTQLAAEYVHRYACRYSGGVYWLNMEDKENIPNEIALCGGIEGLNLEGFDQYGLPDQVKLVQRVWEEKKPRLLVFDNVEDPATVEQWKPKSGGARVLITSRFDRDWPSSMGVEKLALDTLPRPKSLDLLLGGRPETREVEAEMKAAEAVCDLLGDLPLALHLAAEYLTTYKNEVSLVEYEKELRSQPVLENEALVDFVDDPSPTRHIQNIAATFEVSYKKLKKKKKIDKLAAKLFHMAGHFAPTSISRELLGTTVELDAGDSKDRRAMADALNRLISLGLVREEKGGRLLMHRLLREFALNRPPSGMTFDECAHTFEKAVFDFSKEVNASGLPARLASELEHLRHAAQNADARNSNTVSGLLDSLGRHLEVVADYAGAKRNHEMALEIAEKTLGPEHPSVATSLNNLGLVLHALGDIKGAKKNYERAIDIYTNHLGNEHPHFATSLNNLGNVLWDMGDFKAAKKNHERALEIREKTLGSEHPDVAQNLNNLGVVLKEMEDLEGTKKNFERALEIRKKTLGPEHPNVATHLNNVGGLLQEMGDIEGAKKNIERALEIGEKTLGPEHPNVAATIWWLGTLLEESGDKKGAREKYERAHRILEKSLGADHPRTLEVRRDLETLGEGKC